MVLLGLVRFGWVRSGQVRSGQVRSDFGGSLDMVYFTEVIGSVISAI